MFIIWWYIFRVTNFKACQLIQYKQKSIVQNYPEKLHLINIKEEGGGFRPENIDKIISRLDLTQKFHLLRRILQLGLIKIV